MNDYRIIVLYEYCLVILQFSRIFYIILFLFRNDINYVVILLILYSKGSLPQTR